MKTKTSLRLKTFNMYRALVGISLKKFALQCNPPISHQHLLKVLKGERKSKRINKDIDDFIRLHSVSIGLFPYSNIDTVTKKTIKHRK